MSEVSFEDLIPYAKFRVTEDFDSGELWEGEWVVLSGFEPNCDYLEVIQPEDIPDYATDIYLECFELDKIELISKPSQEDIDTMDTLSDMINSLEAQAREIASKYKELGIEKEVVVIHEQNDLRHWHSSNC